MIYALPEYTQRLRTDLRKQGVYNETLKRDQKRKIEELTEENKRLKREKEALKEKIEKLTKTNNR